MIWGLASGNCFGHFIGAIQNEERIITRYMFGDDFILWAADAWFCLSGKANRRQIRSFRNGLGRRPNIAYPERYSDHMLWRKLVDRNPDFVMFSDKLATKEFIQQRCPELPVPRTLWVGSSADDIPDELLCRDVYVKTNHGCNFNFRTRGKPCDRAALRKLTDQWLASVWGVETGEWSYARVKPRLFVEEPVGDAESDLLEFWIRASNGVVVLGSVQGRSKLPGKWIYYLDPQGRAAKGFTDKDDAAILPLPPGLDIREPYLRAVEFTRRLSVGADYLRYDFFWNGKELYGGEITVFSGAGLAAPDNTQVEKSICAIWDLRDTHFLKTRQTGLKRLYAEALRRKLDQERSECKMGVDPENLALVNGTEQTLRL